MSRFILKNRSVLKKKKESAGVLTTALVLVAFVSLLLTGCTKEQGENGNSGRLKVVTTMFTAYDFANQVGGDNADVSMLLKPGAEAHTFDPTPKDIADISRCDVFICNGGENEVWVDSILESIDNPSMKIVRMTDCCDKVAEELVEGMQAEDEHDEEEHDEEEPEWDEHVWMSPVNAQKIVTSICEALCAADETHKASYTANRDAYIEKLQKLDSDIREVLSDGKERMLIFADRFPARYFTEEYDLDYRAAFPGCSADTQASAATIAYIVKTVNEKNIKTIYTIELSDGKLADVVAEKTGAEIKTFYTGHNVSLTDFENKVTYIDLLYRDLDVIR